VIQRVYSWLPAVFNVERPTKMPHDRHINVFLARDDREWLFTFPFPPIPITWSIPISSHSHSQTTVQSLRHKHFWRIKDSANIQYHSTELVTESNSLADYRVQTIAIIY